MSTRKLILAALFCGRAILLAGGIQLVLLARSKTTATVLDEGAVATVGDARATVVAGIVSDNEVVVTVRLTAGSPISDAGVGWALNANGLQPRREVGATEAVPPCDGQSVAAGATLTCLVAFAQGDGTRYVSYSRGGHQAEWQLAPT